MNIGQLYNASRFNGVLAIGDVHGMAGPLLRAVNYAKAHNLYLISLGDLIDGGPQPYQTVKIVKDVLCNNSGAFIIGNHDDKHYRASLGNKVKYGADGLQTLTDIGDFGLDKFYSVLSDVIHHPSSSYYGYFKKTVFAHAATHRSLWEHPDEVHKAAKAMCIYGQVNGKRDERGFPVRLYNWVNEIPTGHTAVVGHDRVPYGKSKTSPLVVITDTTGTAYFMDTSCGKDDVDGVLTGVVFSVESKTLQFSNYATFR